MSKVLLYCSFCGKRSDEVKKLIAGPTVFICDECVDICTSIVVRARAEEAAKITADTQPTQHWRGIAKLTEECGEVMQLLGKAIAFPVGPHPDRAGALVDRVPIELADLKAAIQYLEEANNLPVMHLRTEEKLEKYRKWGLIGVLDMGQLSYNKAS